MIKYICNLCKNEIERKGIVMKVVCLNLMQNNSSAKEISLHFHEECALTNWKHLR